MIHHHLKVGLGACSCLQSVFQICWWCSWSNGLILVLVWQHNYKLPVVVPVMFAGVQRQHVAEASVPDGSNDEMSLCVKLMTPSVLRETLDQNPQTAPKHRLIHRLVLQWAWEIFLVITKHPEGVEWSKCMVSVLLWPQNNANCSSN